MKIILTLVIGIPGPCENLFDGMSVIEMLRLLLSVLMYLKTKSQSFKDTEKVTLLSILSGCWTYFVCSQFTYMYHETGVILHDDDDYMICMYQTCMQMTKILVLSMVSQSCLSHSLLCVCFIHLNVKFINNVRGSLTL
jgi:hypothetical protein